MPSQGFFQWQIRRPLRIIWIRVHCKMMISLFMSRSSSDPSRCVSLWAACPTSGGPECGHAPLEAFDPHGNPVGGTASAGLLYAGCFRCSCIPCLPQSSCLPPGSYSFLHTFFRSFGLAVAMSHMIQGDQNLLLFDKLAPQGFLLPAIHTSDTLKSSKIKKMGKCPVNFVCTAQRSGTHSRRCYTVHYLDG